MKLKDSILLLASILVSAGLFELGLRLLTPFPIHDPASNLAPHEALGYTLSPDFAESDRNGFRNSPALADAESVDIVALGDSHTYGFNVAMEDSWPAVLGEMTGKSVYNYGLGGYGILQYRYLFDEAIKKQPDTILVGLFLMNDLSNYCEFAASIYWIPRLEAIGLNPKVCGRVRDLGNARFEGTAKGGIKSTAIGSLLAYLRDTYFYSLGDEGVPLSIGPQKTWTDLDRLVAIEWQTNTERPRIAEGRQAAFYLFAEMARLADEAGIHFGVVIIPSRERVLSPYLESTQAAPKEWREAVTLEEALVRQFSDYFKDSNIDFIDSLPYVRSALDQGIREGKAIYPIADGHPLPAGYRAYAEAAHALLERR